MGLFSMSKKILFLVNKLSLGGLEKVNVTIVNELAEHENVELYSLKGNSFGYHISSKVKYSHGKRIYWNYFRHPILTLEAIWTNNLYDKKKLNFNQIKKDLNFKNYDFVVLSEADILFANEIIKINPNIKIIGWLHSDFESYKNIYFKNCYNEFIDNLSIMYKVVVVTESDKKKYGTLVPQVFKINNPLTIKKSADCPLELKNKKISFVGRLEFKTKGLDYLIELSRLLPHEWVISIAGDGIDMEKFKKEIKVNEVCDRFEFKGVLKDKDLVKHYLDSDIYILTSRWEGFGLSIIEAMNFGVPVVAFDTVGSREIIGHDNQFGFLVENGDVESMAEKIKLLIDNEDLRMDYSKRSLIRSKNYSLDNIILKWRKLLKE